MLTGKQLGGGVCLYVNKNWCATTVVREELCNTNNELLAVSLRPYYLPREFPQLFIILPPNLFQVILITVQWTNPLNVFINTLTAPPAQERHWINAMDLSQMPIKLYPSPLWVTQTI